MRFPRIVHFLVRACGVLLACLVLGTACGQEQPAPPKRVWRVAVEAEARPFTFVDSQGRPAGFAVELLQAVAAERGLELEFIVMPWSEVLNRFRAGEIDIICNIVETPERRSFIAFSTTTAVLHGALFVRKDHAPIESYQAINGLRVALPRESRAHEFLKRSEWKIDYLFVPSLAECLAALHDGRADAVFAADLVANHTMRERGYSNIVTAPLSFPALDYRERFGVAPGNATLLAELNEGILAIHETGQYDIIYERWVGPLRPRVLGWRDLRPYALPLLGILALTLFAFAWQRRMLLRLAAQTEALRLSEERLSLVLEGSRDGFWDWDTASGVILRSPRCFSMLGYTPAEIPATRDGFFQLVHPDDRARVIQDEEEVWRRRDHFSIELRARAKSGEWKWILDRGKVVSRHPKTGQPTRLTGTHTDITPRKLAQQEAEQMQRRMQETQRLESLGVLAGGIAHDFNNLLTVILGNASLLRLDPGQQSNPRLEKITDATKRAAELCRQLLAYAGKGALTLERLSLNHVVSDTLHLFQLSAQRTAELQCELAPDLPEIEADPLQLQQVITNLLINATEAAPRPGGLIRIATTQVELQPSELIGALPSADLPAGAYVRLTIADNGSGMTPEVRQRVFDPFYTTKALGRGLGLPAVLGIIRSLHGALTLQSDAGQGTSIHIFLPALPPLHSTARAESLPPFAASSTPSVILVVDDDQALRPLYTELLSRLGYTAVIAGSQTAEHILATNPQRFNAVLLDAASAGANCRSALTRLRQHRADLAYVLVSTIPEAEIAQRCPRSEFAAFLAKPFSPESLIAALRSATKRAP